MKFISASTGYAKKWQEKDLKKKLQNASEI